MSGSEGTRRLKAHIERLLASQQDDARLRDHLEGLGHDQSLPGLTWFWGPTLYERNRVMFRSFIHRHFANGTFSGRQWKRIAWADHADRLDAWLTAARANRDTQLVRRLLGWRFAGKDWWSLDEVACRRAVVDAYRAASGPAERATVLDEFTIPFRLDEPSALELYGIDRSAAPFILARLPRDTWGEKNRVLWSGLLAAADASGDEDFRWSLYRRQVPAKQWRHEVLELAQRVTDAEQLCDELLRRHPEGWGLELCHGAIELLEARGRDVMPYVRVKLQDLMGGWRSSRAEAFVRLAEAKGWWDLWAAAIRTAGYPKLFNEAVKALLGDLSISEGERVDRLRALAGVSREWNWPGVGLAVVHALDDDVAVRLYRHYPDMIRGSFRAHVLPRWWQGGPRLLAAAQKKNDEELVDLLASRYATVVRWDYGWNNPQRDVLIAAAESLSDYYQAIRDRDPALFARRAAEVLTRIPAYSIYGYDQLLRTNKLARLLFVRSFDAYLAVPAAVGDLVEGSDIHVQKLAYSILAQDDDRARALTVQWLDILIGTLLRPLHRKTRLAAFCALAGAARADADAAAVVLRRAREALRLPDKKYPKEELVGLIGQILHARPALRGERERPAVFRREAVRS